MAMTNDDMISTLNNLIETCRDGENGFRTAAEGVSRNDLKQLVIEYSRQRAQFVSELQSVIVRLGGDPQDSGSIAASLHRGWIDIKSAVTGKDDDAIVAECERGEDSAKRNYEDALKQNLPRDVADVVSRQSEQIFEAHNRISDLKHRGVRNS